MTGDWTTFAILAAVAFSVLVAPTLRAWVSRRDELAADRYAARHGAAANLATVLSILTEDEPQVGTPDWLASHPTSAQRRRLLLDTGDTTRRRFASP